MGCATAKPRRPRSTGWCARPRASSRSSRCSTASRGKSPAGSASASRWAARSCAGRRVPVRRAAVQPRRQAARLDPVEIKKLQKSLGTTSIYVTHDQLEAMTLADMLVVMNGGKVDQIGPPLEVYQHPATTFVATFIGAPAMNLLKMSGAEPALLLGNGTISGRGRDHRHPAGGPRTGRGRHQARRGDRMPLTVGAVERVGPESFVYGTLDRGDNIIVRLPGTHAPAPGERAIAVANRAKLHVFSADGQRRLSSSS
jgi:hypothetical protein